MVRDGLSDLTVREMTVSLGVVRGQKYGAGVIKETYLGMEHPHPWHLRKEGPRLG